MVKVQNEADENDTLSFECGEGQPDGLFVFLHQRVLVTASVSWNRGILAGMRS